MGDKVILMNNKGQHSTRGGRARGRGRVRGDRGGSGSNGGREGGESPTQHAPIRGHGYGSSSMSRPADRRGRRGRGAVGIYDESRPRDLSNAISEQELGALVSKIQKTPPSISGRAVRPGFGTEGTPTTLLSNFFVLKYPKGMVLYEYGMEFTPALSTNEKRTRERLFELLERSPEFKQHSDHVAHDGAQRLISHYLLPSDFDVAIQFTEGDEGKSQDDCKTYVLHFTGPTQHSMVDLDR